MRQLTRLLAVLLLCAGGAVGSPPAPAPPAFSEADIGLNGLEVREVRWGDVNGDGKLDLVVAGQTGGIGGTRFVRIYHNDLSGSGAFVEDPNDSVFVGFNEGPLLLGDYDNDGDVDLAYGGWSGGGTGNTLYRHEADGSWTLLAANLRGMKGADGAWFDYNNDGLPDLVLTGESFDPPSGDYGLVYRNTGFHTFVESTGILGSYLGQVSVGDFNNDGRLDLIQCGRTAGVNVLRNFGSSFSSTQTLFTHLINSAVEWGDYDNDGFLDFAVCGEKADGTLITEIYKGNGSGTFTPINAGLPGFYTGEVHWGDC
ncbi:MAG: VCBS repeat-containing protein, partial [Planctomycetaceae bacterium]|nr:VCBS repeat-containing protein [Planctomycetaceae bacterium]